VAATTVISDLESSALKRTRQLPSRAVAPERIADVQTFGAMERRPEAARGLMDERLGDPRANSMPATENCLRDDN
jgi:hypothetical protein